jgi:hypothetical protein
MALGVARNTRRLILVLSHEKCVFYFWSAEIDFSCEATTKTANEKLGTTPHINNRPSGIHISTLILSCKPSELFSRFYISSCRFRWNRVGLPFRSNKTSSWFFAKIIFESTTCHLFTKLCLLKRDSAPPGHVREFRALSCSYGFRIGRN